MLSSDAQVNIQQRNIAEGRLYKADNGHE
jgi:hypothetical protein